MTSSPSEPIILLINRVIPFNAVGKVRGLGGGDYGNSVYEEAFGAHVCRMPLSKWRECKKDVVNASGNPWSRWEVDIDIETLPAGESSIDRIRNASADQLDAIVSGLGPLVQAVDERRKAVSRNPSILAEAKSSPCGHLVSYGPITNHPGKHTEESLAQNSKYFSLKKIALEVGMTEREVELTNGLKELRAAILARQLQPA